MFENVTHLFLKCLFFTKKHLFSTFKIQCVLTLHFRVAVVLVGRSVQSGPWRAN